MIIKSLNEGFNVPGINRVLNAPNNRKYKVSIKIQSKTEFMLKTVNGIQLIDNNGKITQGGINSILDYCSNNSSLIKTMGRFDDAFFKENFLLYKVKKDTNRTEKIQFKVFPRVIAEGLPLNIKFVATDNLKNNNNPDVSNMVASTVKLANTDNTTTEPSIDGEIEDAEGSNVTKRFPGHKFRYRMRSNLKTYMMEFGENGRIDAEVIEGGNEPNGVISWENSKVLWYTDIDNSGLVKDGELYTDTKITNKRDNKFFTRIFTDNEFLKQIIDEYEDKYGSSEMTGENLRSMLYYNSSEERIFPDTIL